MRNQMVTWPWRHMTLKGQTRDPNMLRAILKTAGDSDSVSKDHKY